MRPPKYKKKFGKESPRRGDPYHHAKFAEDVLRAPAVGAKMWCFLFFVLVTIRLQSTVRSRGA